MDLHVFPILNPPPFHNFLKIPGFLLIFFDKESLIVIYSILYGICSNFYLDEW